MRGILCELGSDTGAVVTGVLLGAIWTGFRSADAYSRLRRRRFGRALLALERGVEQTYHTYVKAIKAARADGRLTEPEKARARSMARARGVAAAKDAGIDLLRTIGSEYVDLWIARIVARRKRGQGERHRGASD